MNKYETCICGCRASEIHHIMFRSQVPSLIKCKLNLILLCQGCHYSIHHGKGLALNRKLKLEFQNKLEMLLDKQYLTKEEINEVLQISDKALNRLLKTLSLQKGLYVREEVIRACLGGKLIIEEGEK